MVPWGIIWSVVAQAFLGMSYLIVLLYCIQVGLPHLHACHPSCRQPLAMLFPCVREMRCLLDYAQPALSVNVLNVPQATKYADTLAYKDIDKVRYKFKRFDGSITGVMHRTLILW